MSKTYFLAKSEISNDIVFDRAEGTVIEWKEGKNLSVRIETRKQRHKASKKTRVVKKEVPVDTFFNFFVPPQIPDEEV